MTIQTVFPNTTPEGEVPAEQDAAWAAIRLAARAARGALPDARAVTYAVTPGRQLREVPSNHRQALVQWHPRHGWLAAPAVQGPCRDFLELYLPCCGAPTGTTLTVGHLGQSLDGHIATENGDSCYVTGHENIMHLHRMRALSDAVVVGAGTVSADDPRLTTRLVPGDSPVRVILDPGRRLSSTHRVFFDADATTLLVCSAADAARAPHRIGHAEVLGVAVTDGRLALAELLAQLRRRGLRVVFVEGGGETVSAFLADGLLDRLQIAVAPLLIGSGRPGIRLPATARLRDCLRPAHRAYRMGTDVLFDCDLAPSRDEGGAHTSRPAVTGLTRIL